MGHDYFANCFPSTASCVMRFAGCVGIAMVNGLPRVDVGGMVLLLVDEEGYEIAGDVVPA